MRATLQGDNGLAIAIAGRGAAGRWMGLRLFE
jgi:hypothetical protein